MKLICINSKPIKHPNGICSHGTGLIEGNIYSTDDIIYIHPNNKNKCYLIFELNDLKLTTRFIPLSDIDESDVVCYKKESGKILATKHSS